MNDRALLDRLTRALADIAGVKAIALGGSRASGTAVPKSDYDIGLYYDQAKPIDTAARGRVAEALDDRGSRAEVTPLGGWGPWIDGGGWLLVGGAHVDLLYHNLDCVASAIDAAHAGKVERHYQPGHPHAFLTAIYMGEVARAETLYDPARALAALRRRCDPYPPALAKALRGTFEWEAQFSLENAEKSLPRHDINYLAGCAFRSVACLCQALFALNGVYLLNEKGAVAGVRDLPVRPRDFAARVTAVHAAIGAGDGGRGLHILGELLAEVRGLSR